MPRRSLFALFLFLVSTPLLAQTLTIRTGGDRVVGFPGSSCGYSVYSPSVLRDPSPAIPGREMVMYSAGGLLVDPCTNIDFMSPARFGDKIWIHYRDADGAWRDRDGDPATIDEPIIDRRNFPWMSDVDHLTDTPGAYVGHVSSPSVVKVGNRYFMSFVAVMNDPNLCAGEHHWSGTPCGICHERWSFFVPMWAASDDGENWRVFEGRPQRIFKNRAANAAVFWTFPSSVDVLIKSRFQGVVRTSMIAREEGDNTFFYIAFNFSGRHRMKFGMVRLKYDETSEWGWSKDPQIWDGKTWNSMYMGQMPFVFNDLSNRGNIFEGYVASITETAAFPGYKYIAMITANSGYSHAPGDYGWSNAISFQLSNDLVNWTPAQPMESQVPFFADGNSYDVSVVDPFYVEQKNGFEIYFASADGDRSSGVERDGFHDCEMYFPEDFPTAPFIGLGIYVGRGNSREDDQIKEPDPVTELGRHK